MTRPGTNPRHAVPIPLRWLVLILLGVTATRAAETEPRPATAEETAFFKKAMKNSAQDTEHWAYTETTTMKASKGRPHGPTVVRFDPSRPYAEQYTPVTVKGKPPSRRDLTKYREKGEKRGEKLNRRYEAAAKAGAKPGQVLNEINPGMDFNHLLVVQEDAERITFDVPLKPVRKDIPVEKLQFLVQLGKQAQQAEMATLRFKESVRMKLVAKVKAGAEASIHFGIVDPNFGPVITSMTGDLGLSLLFIPVDATVVATRTEWQRVKAFDERFSVNLAPLQLLGF